MSRWNHIIGPTDPRLAVRTDPDSLRACYAHDADDIVTPRSNARINTQLVCYFGGRISTNHIIDVELYKNTPLSLDKKKHSEPMFNAKISYLLSVKAVNVVLVVLSPLVTPRLIGLFLMFCERFGFIVKGIKRIKLAAARLNKKC